MFIFSVNPSWIAQFTHFVVVSLDIWNKLYATKSFLLHADFCDIWRKLFEMWEDVMNTRSCPNIVLPSLRHAWSFILKLK